MPYKFKFIIFNVLFIALAYLISSLVNFLTIDNSTILTYFVFLFITAGIHFVLVNKENTDAGFVRKFMLTTVLKMFLFLGVIVIYLLMYKSEAKHFIIWFLIHYAAFTVFETAMLVSQKKK